MIKAKEKYAEKIKVVVGRAKQDFSNYILFIFCVSTLLTFEYSWSGDYCNHKLQNCKHKCRKVLFYISKCKCKAF